MSKRIYLTFDDGPVPEVTPVVLDILQKEGVRATFFMVGENAKRYPDLVDRVRYAGHRIGCHTFHHLKGWGRSVDEYIQDVDICDPYLGGARLFRPPYGRIRIPQWIRLRKKGYKIFLWNVLTRDYHPLSTPERMMNRVRRSRNGDIIVFHDSVKAAQRMLAVLPEAIHWLKEQGFEFSVLRE